MAEIQPRLLLECGVPGCGHRPPNESVMEAFQLHMQVEHDSDDLRMNLAAVCTCGATMTFTESRPTGGGFKDYFRCEPCGNTGWIKRNSDGPRDG